MRIILATLAIASLAACADGGGRSDFSGEASRVAERQASERCAADGKRAQLRNISDNPDGSRRFEYQCVQ